MRNKKDKQITVMYKRSGGCIAGWGLDKVYLDYQYPYKNKKVVFLAMVLDYINAAAEEDIVYHGIILETDYSHNTRKFPDSQGITL